jgi:uncharacterized damage-inducible protein DinB
MYPRVCALALALGSVPLLAVAQGSQSPVLDAFRAEEQSMAKNLIAAVEQMPADKLGFKPTPAQMTVGAVAAHISEDNDYLCSRVTGVPEPQRDKVVATDSKEKLVARLRETFQFCETALAKVEDSKLAEQVPGSRRPVTRARMLVITVGDWNDHYSQLANYLRLNGLLPPTAQRSSQ